MKRIIVAMSLVALGISGCASWSDFRESLAGGQASADTTAPADEDLNAKQSPYPQATDHGLF